MSNDNDNKELPDKGISFTTTIQPKTLTMLVASGFTIFITTIGALSSGIVNGTSDSSLDAQNKITLANERIDDLATEVEDVKNWAELSISQVHNDDLRCEERVDNILRWKREHTRDNNDRAEQLGKELATLQANQQSQLVLIQDCMSRTAQ